MPTLYITGQKVKNLNSSYKWLRMSTLYTSGLNVKIIHVW